MSTSWKIINDAKFATVEDLTRINSVENLASEESVRAFSRQSAIEQLLQVQLQLVEIIPLLTLIESQSFIELTPCVFACLGIHGGEWLGD